MAAEVGLDGVADLAGETNALFVPADAKTNSAHVCRGIRVPHFEGVEGHAENRSLGGVTFGEYECQFAIGFERLLKKLEMFFRHVVD